MATENTQSMIKSTGTSLTKDVKGAFNGYQFRSVEIKDLNYNRKGSPDTGTLKGSNSILHL